MLCKQVPPEDSALDMNYLFSIIIPTYKRSKELSVALDSLCRQKNSFSNFEVVIINDGSPDGYELSEFYSVLDITYAVNEQNLGVAASRNKAVTLAVGKWLLFLDDDDQMENNYLYILANHIEKYPMCQCFWSSVEIKKSLSENSEIRYYTSKANTYQMILKQFLSIGLSFGVAMRKDFFMEIGMLDTSFTVGEDTELFLRAVEFGVTPYPIESIGIIKNEAHKNRLSFDYRLYSELNVYEKMFSRHHKTLCKYIKIYSSLLFWAYKVHLLNGNSDKAHKIFVQLELMGFPSTHIANCYSKGKDLSDKYLSLSQIQDITYDLPPKT